MKRSAAVFLILGAVAVPSAAPSLDRFTDLAQARHIVPFDMQHESAGERERARPQAEVPPLPAPPAASVPVRAPDIVRHLLPMGDLRFAGERASRAWSIFLTAGQAEAAKSLKLAYINAIAVMPEVSRLQVFINGQPVLKTAIASPDGVQLLEAPLAEGMMRAGANSIRIEAEQRHRVACSVDGTYELWTDIDAARTVLTFGNDAPALRLQSLDDLPAAGFDRNGRTTLSVVVPGGVDAGMEQPLLRLSQALALRGRFSHPVVALPQSVPEGSRPGELVVVMAPAARLPPALASAAGAMSAGAMSAGRSVGFTMLRDGSSALLITGAAAKDIDQAVAGIAATAGGSGAHAAGIDTASFIHPPAPFVTEGAELTFAQLGVENQSFSGRRFETSVTVGLPADFYAQAYGEARLLIDAGISPALLADSRFTVSVNGHVASVLPLETRTGERLRQLPIRIPMRHFRSGVNVITLEGTFVIAADAACTPETVMSNQPRFVLFETSRLIIPRFARIGALPRLSAFGARGFPYWQKPDALRVLLADGERATIAAASTLLARLAAGAQRVQSVEIVPHADAVRDRDALLIGAVGKLPAAAFTQTGLAAGLPTLRPEVAEKAEANDSGTLGYDAVTESFRQRRNRQDADAAGMGRGLDAAGPDAAAELPESGIGRWLADTFDLTFDALLPFRASVPYSPPDDASLVLAQGTSPEGAGLWTVMTAASAPALESAVDDLTRPDLWPRVGGAITAFRRSPPEVRTLAPERVILVPTQPLDLFNLRMVGANWLSRNFMVYALALFMACVLLGVGTHALLSQLGRR